MQSYMSKRPPTPKLHAAVSQRAAGAPPILVSLPVSGVHIQRSAHQMEEEETLPKR